MKKQFKIILIFFAITLLFGCGEPDQPREQELKATITSPDKSVYSLGKEIYFAGSGRDCYRTDDGKSWETYYLAGSDLVWSSSINGDLGVGENFTRDDLSPGDHKIKLTAIGLDGTDSDSVAITVNGTKVTIIEPTNNSKYSFGDNIIFKGRAENYYLDDDGNLKLDTIPEDDLVSLEWTSSINGWFGEDDNFTKDNLSIGVHTITLTIMVGQNDTASALVKITVKE